MNLMRLTPVALVLLLAGCAREQDYVEVMRQQQVAWNGVADVLETVKDKESMAAAKEELVARMDACEAAAQKARDLPQPSPEFLKKHDQKVYFLKSAMERASAEVRRIRQLPGGEAFCRQFQSQHPGLLSAVQP
ncbi:MAG TPA: hypothetical protein VFE62_15880 [Gemmataceae bacterium]|nr:hypothetical protein [Gemmataceae bacterium]